ncbi:MAG: hypothetical protein ACT4N8_06705 [Sphingosinicella sp.]|uniref:hypothetical protein n=1 Tax=Sphingosinicella sp. TaxID=1917971 RepID=UPI004037C9F7
MSPPFFRRARAQPRLAPDAQVRQGRAVKAAQAALVTTEAVRVFLNTHDSALGGRPLDLAVASEAGLSRVEAAIHAAAWLRGAAS